VSGASLKPEFADIVNAADGGVSSLKPVNIGINGFARIGRLVMVIIVAAGSSCAPEFQFSRRRSQSYRVAKRQTRLSRNIAVTCQSVSASRFQSQLSSIAMSLASPPITSTPHRKWRPRLPCVSTFYRLPIWSSREHCSTNTEGFALYVCTRNLRDGPRASWRN
jgi:hypothetical protein